MPRHCAFRTGPLSTCAQNGQHAAEGEGPGEPTLVHEPSPHPYTGDPHPRCWQVKRQRLPVDRVSWHHTLAFKSGTQSVTPITLHAATRYADEQATAGV